MIASAFIWFVLDRFRFKIYCAKRFKGGLAEAVGGSFMFFFNLLVRLVYDERHTIINYISIGNILNNV